MRYTEEECAAWLGIASEANRHAKAIKAQLKDDLLAMGDKGVDSLALRANGVKVGKVQRIDGKAEVAMLEPEDDCNIYDDEYTDDEFLAMLAEAVVEDRRDGNSEQYRQTVRDYDAARQALCKLRRRQRSKQESYV